MFNTGKVEVVGRPWFSIDDMAVERETMLFQCDTSTASACGGYLTGRLLSLLMEVLPPADYGRLRVDTRSHMLMKGWYPCIPGWHCDFRTGIEEVDAGTKHYMFWSSGPTAEYDPDRRLSIQGDDWGEVDRSMSDFVNILHFEPGRVYCVDSNELHRGTPWDGEPCHWRWFFRGTVLHKDHPEQQYANKVRKQTQVYCDLHAGW